MHICTHMRILHTHKHTHICTHVHMYTHACAHKYTHRHTCIHTHMCGHSTQAHMHTHAHYVHTHALTGIQAYTCTLCTHTHVHYILSWTGLASASIDTTEKHRAGPGIISHNCLLKHFLSYFMIWLKTHYS